MFISDELGKQQPIALITGANAGIGQVTALELAKKGIRVVLATRSEQSTQPLLDRIRQMTQSSESALWLPLDLADLASVRACAQSFLALNVPLRYLINNAGVAGAKGLTAQGFEWAFGVNHLGHFLLTRLLLERLKQSPEARVVTVASRAHLLALSGMNWDALQRTTQSLTAAKEYGVSKLANILFSAELGRQLVGTGVSAYSVHPGVVATSLWRHVPKFFLPILKMRPMLTAEQGARTTLHCVLDAPQTETGLYYADARVQSPSKIAQDLELARHLWEQSMQWTAAYAH
ncbi:MAG: SDR family NAD(P)-dependent oxidoreductase [Alcaligenaceae bacterium]|nr:SDR family NAD(P)-dependent oxidoreductase [Alcaligenaceae bacterium]